MELSLLIRVASKLHEERGKFLPDSQLYMIGSENETEVVSVVELHAFLTSALDGGT
jgi:hypothetical protein